MVGEPAGAPEVPPRLHHVVFAVRRESFERASEYFGGLGFRLAEFVLDDVGLRVAIDWAGGVELLTPTDDHLAEPGSVGDFLRVRGRACFRLSCGCPTPTNSAGSPGLPARRRGIAKNDVLGTSQ